MTGIGPIFARLGLDQYVDSFIVEGFDTWETVLDIQEGDLDALNVKLGHRRKLQREIANTRDLLGERPLGSPTTEASGDIERCSDRSLTPTAHHDRPNIAEVKRKYRRHPKPDRNAPERPPSAYVLFSNNIRSEIRHHNLSFTEIAKTVGERWQRSTMEEKGPYELQANAAKQKFNTELAEYKKTDQYREYSQYILDFKVKHSGDNSEAKRAKVLHGHAKANSVAESSGLSIERRPKEVAIHTRTSSDISMTSSTYPRTASSPNGIHPSPSSTQVGYGTSANMTDESSSPLESSPSLRVDHSNRQSSPRTHAILPTLAKHQVGSFSPSLQQHQSSYFTSIARSDSSEASAALPITPADDGWHHQPPEIRSKCSEWPGLYNALLVNGPGASRSRLPSLQSADRVSDISRDREKYMLPLPAPSAACGVRSPSGNHSHISGSTARWSASGAGLNQPLVAVSRMESPENDAANTLAVLKGIKR